MKSPLHLLSTLLLLLLPTALCAQSPLDTLAMRAIMVNQLYPQEKVYLHFDNTSYSISILLLKFYLRKLNYLFRLLPRSAIILSAACSDAPGSPSGASTMLSYSFSMRL